MLVVYDSIGRVAQVQAIYFTELRFSKITPNIHIVAPSTHLG